MAVPPLPPAPRPHRRVLIYAHGPSTRSEAVDNPRRTYTVAEVAAAMRVSKMTVYRLVHSGELPAVRVGRSFRVPEQAVHDYLDKAYVETA